LLVPVLLMLIANREIALFFKKSGGLAFACGALLFHQVYYLYSGAAFAWVMVEQTLLKYFQPKSSSK